MDMGHDGPSSLVQQDHEAVRGILSIAAALRGPDHHPGDLGRGRRRDRPRTVSPVLSLLPCR